MLVTDGRVVARGPEVESEGKAVDMEDAYLMPSFIDNHCHILPTGLDLAKLHLGGCDSHEEVLQKVRERLPDVEPGKWLHAVHYDQTRYQGEHLTRHQLDKISPNTPILLRHVNGHASVANSAALSAAGISENEANPSGGEFRRDAHGLIDGVLLEHAHERVTAASPKPSREEMVEAIMQAGGKMAALGISCASDMMTGRFSLEEELEAYAAAAEKGNPIRVRLYLQWGTVFGPRAIDAGRLRELEAAMKPQSCRVAGIKIFADGAIGSATAAIYGRYTGAPATGPLLSAKSHSVETAETSGTLIYAPEKLANMVRTAHDAGYRLAIHSIGDYATDLVMNVYEATGDPSRHRIEHAMLLSDAQIERLAKLDISVSMQPEFLMHFGHSYLRQLGPERARTLNRAHSLLEAGVRLSFSSDRPIVAGNPQDGMRNAVHRPDTFDPEENISPSEAWLAYTSAGARANGDDDQGDLEVGDLADFQRFEDDPLAMLTEENGRTGED